MQNYSILKQERLKRGWSYDTVEAKIGIPQRSQENAENGYHFPRQRHIELYCNLYGKSAEQLGLVKSGMIETRISHFSAPQEGTTPMSEIIRRAAFYDLGSKLSSLIDVWPKRNYHYEELQGEINKAILDSHATASQDSIYEVSRRDVLKSVGLAPIQLCAGLDGIINLQKAKADTDTLLKHCAAGIVVCWYLRRGKELVFTSDLISEYIKVLRALVYSKSEMHRKAAATLLAQCCMLQGSLNQHLKNSDQGVALVTQAIEYSAFTENLPLEAFANRLMVHIHWNAGNYEQALPVRSVRVKPWQHGGYAAG